MYDHRNAVGECNGTEEECPGEEDCEVCQEQGKLKSRTKKLKSRTIFPGKQCWLIWLKRLKFQSFAMGIIYSKLFKFGDFDSCFFNFRLPQPKIKEAIRAKSAQESQFWSTFASQLKKRGSYNETSDF